MSGIGTTPPGVGAGGRPPNGIPAIVLAAGAARRFGTPKQTARLGGRPLLDHVLDAARSADEVDDIIVVLGAHAGAVQAAVDLTGTQVVRCASWERGMSASLQAGVAALSPRAPRALVLLADQPRITAQAITLIAAAATRAPRADAVRAAYDGVGGHPVVLGRVLLDAVAQLRGDVGARELLAGADVRLVEVAHVCDPADVDTPQDLDALEAIIR